LCGAGDQTQSLEHARQTLHQQTTSPALLIIFEKVYLTKYRSEILKSEREELKGN
jgi:hypothetical protein